MKEEKAKTGAWKAVARFIVLVICGTILGVNVYLMNARNLVGNQLPMPFGYGAAVILSGSMEPEFSKGDLIVVAERDKYHENEIVVYQDVSSLVVHRIIEIDGDRVITKGDANPSPDQPISMGAVKGKVLFWIPFVGKLVSFLKTPVGIVCTILGAIALIEIPCLKERRKDDEERDKLIEEIRRLKEEYEER